jgi:hypothetical protein
MLSASGTNTGRRPDVPGDQSQRGRRELSLLRGHEDDSCTGKPLSCSLDVKYQVAKYMVTARYGDP